MINIDEVKVGETPIKQLNILKEVLNLKANLFAKLEMYNPAGSIKDRVALQMIKDALSNGELKEGGTIIESTSGNTGIGLAYIARECGFKCKIVMPNTMSVERINLLKGYDAEVVLTDGKLGMSGSILEAEKLNRETPNSLYMRQFDNPSNPKAHYYSTAREIYRDLDGKIDVLVAGVGTGGTITGIGKYLKEQNPKIKIVAVEPATSAVLSGEKAGAHKIQGIGAGFVPKVLDTSIYDEVIKVTNEAAFEMTKKLKLVENLSVGISSGCAVYAGVKLAVMDENKDKNIAIVCADGGEKYLSTGVFD